MAKQKKLKVFEYNGKHISFEFGDGKKMVNATEMAKAFPKKRLKDFFQLKQTAEYINTLDNYLKNSRGDNSPLDKIRSYSTTSLAKHFPDLIMVIRGGQPELQGTWIHERVALKFAAWLSPKFELWVYDRILELLTKGKVELKAKQVSEEELLFYLQKIADNSAEASFLAEQLGKRIGDEFRPLKE